MESKQKIRLEDQDYVVWNVPGFSLSQFCRLIKTLYGKKEVFFRENRIHPDLKEFMDEHWDDFQEVTVEEAFREKNIEKRRVYFFCLKPERIFRKIPSEIISLVSLDRKGIRNGKEYDYKDVYELHRIKLSDLFPDTTQPEENLYFVKCTCNSTGREYYIWVNECEEFDFRKGKRVLKKGYDAIDAIAWTLRTPVKEDAVECFYRQGDVLITKVKDSAGDDFLIGEGMSRTLTREEYINKLILQS